MRIHKSSIAPATPQQHHSADVVALCSQDAPPIDAYEQYNPLPPHCHPVALQSNLIFTSLFLLHTSSVHLTCRLPAHHIRLMCLTLCQQDSERDDGVLIAWRGVNKQNLCACLRACVQPGFSCQGIAVRYCVRAAWL
jgi:hypothetical protein